MHGNLHFLVLSSYINNGHQFPYRKNCTKSVVFWLVKACARIEGFMEENCMNSLWMLDLRQIVLCIQYAISLVGILIIVSGVVVAAVQYMTLIVRGELIHEGSRINNIRLTLGRVLILGLEFIVAADLIGTTTTPDYYALGLAAIIVAIRTLLSFSLNRELMSLSKK
jgi:uncharacterized membrane protein